MLATSAPLLLPREWHLQAAAAGTGALLGYGLARGVQHVAAAARTTPNRPRRRVPRRVATAALGVAAVLGGAWWWLDHLAHREVARWVGMEEPTVADHLLATAVGLAGAAAVVLVLVLLARGARWCLVRVCRPLERAGRPTVVRPLVAAVGAVVFIGLIGGIGVPATLDRVRAQAAEDDTHPPQGTSAPQSPLRSGSPEAVRPWDDLGYHGRRFTFSGPDAARIEATIGRPALEPIRVYAPLRGDGMSGIVEEAVGELRRTGAFDRSHLHVVTTTGTGWVPEFDAESVEYLTGGDVATVAVQYSYLPSVLATLVDAEQAEEAGTMLLERIERELAPLPEDARPRLLMSGHSLGAHGGMAPFADVDDMLARVDGAVWIGPLDTTPLRRKIVASRRDGSPELAPVVGDADRLRYATGPDELGRHHDGEAYGPWASPRVVVLQYPTDALALWGPRLAWSAPDWMSEHVGHPVMTAGTWLPLVTFVRVSAEVPIGADVPEGHGHNYEDDMVPVWAAVLAGADAGVDLAGDDRHAAIAEAIRTHLTPSA